MVLGCSDGHDYVVKAMRRPNRDLAFALVNDQVIGRFANAIGAPVPPVALVDVPAELIAAEPELAGIPAGIAHGSRYVPRASATRQGIAHQNAPGNRGRYADLAVMYGWAGANDHQFFYEDGTNLVWSFDHGHFFPGGPAWTIQSLRAAGPAAVDGTIQSACNLTASELGEATSKLSSVHRDDFTTAIGWPPEAWYVTLDERIEMAVYLHRRQTDLVR